MPAGAGGRSAWRRGLGAGEGWENQFTEEFLKDVCSFLSLSFFACGLGVWTFLGQGLNLHHRDDPGCCSENTRSLTCCDTREVRIAGFFSPYFPHVCGLPAGAPGQATSLADPAPPVGTL